VGWGEGEATGLPSVLSRLMCACKAGIDSGADGLQ